MVSRPGNGQINYYGDNGWGCKDTTANPYGYKCLAKLTMDDIYEMCKVQSEGTSGSSYFSFSWF